MQCIRSLRTISHLSEQHPREQGLKPVLPWRAIKRDLLSEQHPREQGLKLKVVIIHHLLNRLSEQHPREQGLKLYSLIISSTPARTFRATSKRTRIETAHDRVQPPGPRDLSEQHPREQGLKLSE